MRHLLVHDLGEVHDRLALAALVARHQGIASTPVSRHQPPVLERQHPVGPRPPAVRLWVTTTTAVSNSRASRANRSCSRSLLCVVEVARRLVGQHAPAGSVTSARATATRCCSPPESCAGRWRHRARQPHRGEQLLAPASRAAASAAPAISSGIITFSSARELPQQVVELEDEADLPVAQRRQLRRVRVAVAQPVQRTAAAVGRSSAPSRCSRVLLPDPLAPTMATNSPRGRRSGPRRDEHLDRLPSPPR